MKVRFVLLAVTVLLLAAWYVPQVSADRFRAPIHDALETAVGRKVEIGQVKFRLLPTPGFTVENVRIGEDPRIGSEPIAYITALRAVPRLSALFGGPLAFYSIDLQEASVNITRVEAGSEVRWNVTSLLRPALLRTFPSIHLNAGRVNFKLGDTKSIFYLLNTDVDLWPPNDDQGAWSFRIRTEPARTDTLARGFGSFAGRGEWRQVDSSLTLDMKLEKSQVGELLTFFAGHDTGIRGQVSGEAHFAGPVTKVGVRAHLAMADVHSWELPAAGQGEWPVSVGGVIDVPGQSVNLRATADNAPLDVRYRVTELAGRPRWGVMASFAKLPTAPLLSIARNLGATIPEDMKLTGTMEGAVGYSTSTGVPKLDGQIQIADTTIGVAKTPPLKMDLAQLTFSGSTANLTPAEVKNEHGDTAMLSGSLDSATGAFEVGLSSGGMEIASLRNQISVAGAPILAHAISGIWSGDLHYKDGWTGNLHLENADVPFEAFSEPVHIVSADAVLEKAGVSMKKVEAALSGLKAFGDYRYDVTAIRPHRFHVTLPDVESAALEKVLAPTLRRGNLFTDAFHFGGQHAPQPNWLRDMRADGTVNVTVLHMLDVALTKVRTRVIWDGAQVKLASLNATMDKAQFTGGGTVDLSDRKPAYRIAGTLNGLPWRSGQIAAEGEAVTSGLGAELLAGLHVKGSFHGKGLDFSPLDFYSTADGCFDWSWDSRISKLKLTQLALTGADGIFVGEGEAQDDGQLLLKLSDGAKQVQAAGSIWRGGVLRAVGQ